MSDSSRDSTQTTRARSWFDRGAMSLSVVCALHCLLLPIVAIGVPVLSETALFGERAHLWLLIAAVPLSVAALITSQRHHPNRWVAAGIVSGLVLLGGGVIAHEAFGHGMVEVSVTLAGAGVLLLAHLANLRLHRMEPSAAHSGH